MLRVPCLIEEAASCRCTALHVGMLRRRAVNSVMYTLITLAGSFTRWQVSLQCIFMRMLFFTGRRVWRQGDVAGALCSGLPEAQSGLPEAPHSGGAARTQALSGWQYAAGIAACARGHHVMYDHNQCMEV